MAITSMRATRVGASEIMFVAGAAMLDVSILAGTITENPSVIAVKATAAMANAARGVEGS
jgi:hypothetical protein